MSIKTGRAGGTAEVTIDKDNCNLCGACVKVCTGAPLHIEDRQVKVDQSIIFGCIACGLCVAVCPRDCITVTGRAMSPGDFFAIPPIGNRATHGQLKSLMLARRSTRNFKDRSIDKETIDRIIDTASTAPMGIPPSDVEITVFSGKEKVQAFAKDITGLMYRSRWFFGPVMRTLLRPFIGKAFAELSRTFIYPISKLLFVEGEKGNDLLFYGAPLVMYFHTSAYSDPADPLIAATYAILAAESLGIGTCMIGTVQIIHYSKKLKNKYGIALTNRPGIAVIFGYPAVVFHKSIKRTFSRISYV